MEQKGEPDLEPDPDPDFAYPCMRCAQRVVLTEELMTGSNLCCFSQDVPCAYCYMRKADCHPVPAELKSPVRSIVNLADNLDVAGLSDCTRRVLVERGLALGKELRAKWAGYQRRRKKVRPDGDEGDGSNGEEWVVQQTSKSQESTKEAAARHERTNRLLEQQNGLLAEQTALLHKLSEMQTTRLDQMSDLMHQLIDEQAKYSQEILSQLQSNAPSLERKLASKPVENPVPFGNTNPSSLEPTAHHPTPTSPKSEVSHLLSSFIGKTRKRMNSSSSSSLGKRAQTRSCTG